MEFNESLAIFNPNELKILDDVLETLKNKSFYHSSKFSKQEYDVIKKLLKFPGDKAFPTLDIYRMFLMHPGATENYKVFETGIENLSALIGYLGDSPQPTQLMVLRCLTNLFKHPASVYMLTQKRQFVIDHTAQFIASENKNVRNAVITLFLNYSILFLDKNDSEGRIQIVSALAELFS